MATKGKDSSNITARKEKKVTSSSNSHTIHKQPNPKSAATASSINNIDHKDKSAKPVPNYLKPTFSSKSDSLKPVNNNNKKTQNNIISNEDATQKLLRRRSLDRPPSAARLQKSLVSPDPKDRFKPSTPIRSSSFSSSASRLPISTTSKPVMEKNSKSFKPVKSQKPVVLEIVNRSSSFSRVSTSSLSKNSNNQSHLSKAPNIIPNRTVAPAFNTETKQEIINKQSLLVQEEAEENVEREVVQVANTERKEDVDALKDDTEVIKDTDEDDEKVNPIEIISVVAEGQTSSQVSQVEETESYELQENENKHQEEEEENHYIHSSDNHGLDQEGVADNVVKAESDEDKEEDEEEINVNETVASSEETKKEEMEHGNEGSEEELIKSKEGEDHVVMEGKVEGEEEEGKQEVANEVQNPRGEQVKKETPPSAYNDVIEETKNKLLGLRKNNVKALVGAFETVIDYETAGSK